jgi:hypothetical protein
MRKLSRFAVIGIAALTLLGLGSQGGAPEADASEQTVTIYWDNAPAGLVAAAFEEKQWPLIVGVQQPCYDCYITGVTPDLEYDSDPGPGVTWAQATYSTGAMLHHMVLFNHNLIDPTCAHDALFSALGDRFFASGDERGTLQFAPGYGYYIPPSDGAANNYWNLNLMVHNVSPSQKTFRLKMDFNYHPAADNLKNMRHLWLDVGNCGGSQYPVGTGFDDEHWDWTLGEAASPADDLEGKILGMGGHVHDWGISVSATKGIGGTLICNAIGGYAVGSIFAPDGNPSAPSPTAAHPTDNMDLNPGDPTYNGHIEQMSGCTPNTVVAVGDTIQLHAQYNTDGPIDDVMGIMNAWMYDNCPTLTNPTQEDSLDDPDGAGPLPGDDYGDACDADADGDGLCNTSGVQGSGGSSCTGNDTDDDGDGYSEDAESGTPLCTGSADDDSDGTVNDGCPGGPAKVGAFSEAEFKIGTSGMARCGTGNVVNPSPSWPSDFVSNGIPSSTDRVTIIDVTSYIAPTRRLDTSPGDAAFSSRWDLVPGKGLFSKFIGINDLTSLIAGASGNPTMFGGAKAFNGATCTGS